jgi:hypothetical protein
MINSPDGLNYQKIKKILSIVYLERDMLLKMLLAF